MFTGLIEETGKITALNWEDTNLNIVISAQKILTDVHEGDSIAINGVCLTVRSFTDTQFTVTAIKETLVSNYRPISLFTTHVEAADWYLC